MESHEENFFTLKAKDLMTTNPKTIKSNEKLTQASELMNDNMINALIVVNETDKLVGIVHRHNLAI
jgi:arabinose-5-phosphate isomerase